MNYLNKADLLGTVEEKEEKLLPDVEHMEILRIADRVIIGFCQNCGSYRGLKYKEAEKVFLALKQPLEFDNTYLIFSSCSTCKGNDKEIELKSF